VRTRPIRWRRRINRVRTRSRLRRRPKDNSGTWLPPVPVITAGYPKNVLSEERVGIERYTGAGGAVGAGEDDDKGDDGDSEDDEDAF